MAGMVHVCVAGKTVRSHCYTRTISEGFRDKKPIINRCIKLIRLLYFTFVSYDSITEHRAIEADLY